MRIQGLILPSLAFGLLVTAGGHGAPNATHSSFFPSKQLNVDINRGNSDPYMAEGSEFFPDNGMKHVKFPGSQLHDRQQSSNSAEAALHLQQQQHMQFQQHQQQQQQHPLPQQVQASQVVIPVETSNTDEVAANEAIDVILSSARTGKNLNLAQGGEELVKVASDPKIKEQLASGNEAEARGYIRNKLCSLGLMPCDHHGPVEKQGLLPPGGGYGLGHQGWGPGIPARDVTLVQPVALKPVGHPIAAVPLDHQRPVVPHGLPHPHPHHPHHRGGYGHGKVYGHPPPLPPKPIYRPGPPPPPPGHSNLPHPGKPVIEHVHHHIHHQPTVHHHGPPPPGYGSPGGIYSSEEFGLSAKNPLSVSTPGGEAIKVASFIPPPAQKSHPLAEIETNSFNVPQGLSRFHSSSSSSSSFGSSGSSGFGGDFNRIEDCTCVRITQCASYDIVGQSTSGREVVSGFGKPNYGQVGYGIDPRNKLATGIESNSTDAASGEEGSTEEAESSENEQQTQGRSLSSSIEAEDEATTLSPSSGEEKPRSRRDVSSDSDGLSRVDTSVIDEQTAASGDGTSEPRPAHGEGRLIGQLLSSANGNTFINNLTKFAGFDFGDDPTQLVKIENTNLRILGKLFAIEPTFGVSFGLPGGYAGGYPLNPINPVGNNPVVNPYQEGIPLGPININPLVSFQKSKDKTKTKLWRPLVNLHITPNTYLFKGVKAVVKAVKGKGLFGGWGAPEYLYGGGYPSIPSAVPVPYPVPVPSAGVGYGFGGIRPQGYGRPPVYHNHDHFHHYPNAHSSSFVARPSYSSSYGSSSSSPYYAGTYTSRPYSYGSGGGYGYAKGASYGPSVEYSPSPYFKLDKKGPLDLALATMANFSPSGIKTPSGFGFGTSGLGQSFDTRQVPTNVKKPGKVSEISGLTPEQENLLEALLKEEEEENRSANRYRSGLLGNTETNENNKPSGNVEFVENNRNNNGGSSQSSSGSKTIFPDEISSSTSNNHGFLDSSSSGSTSSISESYRTGVPINFPDSRLPVNAASMSSGIGSDSHSQFSPSLIFPVDERQSIFQDTSSSSSNSNRNDQTATYQTFNNNDDNNNDNVYQEQGSSVTFPKDSTSSTSSHIRMTREIRTQPPPPTAEIDGRVLQPDEERQLNIGGSCPGGYVCCRNPRQNNLYNKPTGSGTNNFQQVSNNPFGTQSNPNAINSFSQGHGQCGKRNARGITGRISNPGFTEGDTDYGEYPWQVAILKKDGYDNVYVCGGALIDSRHIITAAHCIKGHAPSELRVRLGEWDVNHETEFYPHVERDISAIAIHPEFYAGNLFNDIAVVKMEGYVDFRQNPHISPICIPPKGYEFAGQRCFVTGWGKDAFGEIGKYQNVLKEVDLPVLDNFDCEQKLKRTRLGPDFTLHPGFLCAGGEAGRDACKGDGGGPLVCQVGSQWQIAGIVSWGVGCGEQNVPGVYVKVSQYNEWIKKTIDGY